MGTRFWRSAFVLTAASLIVGFVVHGIILHEEYAKLPHLFRSEAESKRYFSLMLLAHFMIGFGMTWMYRRGIPVEKPQVLQGVCFGLGLATLTTLPTCLIYYAVQPMPGEVVAKQIVFEVLGVVLMGILVVWLNRPEKP
jgi:hypothetical protein